MLKISTLALVALLTLSVATIGATSAANAATACPSPTAGCLPPPPPPPPPPPDGGGPDPEGDPDPYNPPPPPPGGKIDVEYTLALECAVKDEAPVTDDFFLLNIGSKELPAGLKIRYEIPTTGERGAFLLPRSLAAGQKAEIPGLLKGVASDSECRAMVIT